MYTCTCEDNDYLESIKIHLKIYNAKGLTLQLDKTKNEN